MKDKEGEPVDEHSFVPSYSHCVPALSAESGCPGARGGTDSREGRLERALAGAKACG